jgi:GNAT superfamily N-acetyltransferase
MVGMAATRIRAADAADAAFMTSMLISAMNWSPEHLQSSTALLADPQVWQYIADWPQPNDRGLIAVDDGDRPLGACWLRYRPWSARGFGFIASDIPELTIGVRSDARRTGIGRALLHTMADQARSRGVARLSLSVEHGNPAAHLYRSEGWRTVKSEPGADTMALDLTTPPPLAGTEETTGVRHMGARSSCPVEATKASGPISADLGRLRACLEQ